MVRQPTLFDADVLIGRHPRRGHQGTVDDLLASMDQLGIAEAAVGHTMSWLHDPAVGNERVTALVAGRPRLRPCWVMLPDTCGELGPPGKFAEEARRVGAALVRAYPHDHGYGLDDANAAGVLSSLAAGGLPLIVDIEQTSWSAVEAVAERLPNLSIIVANVGYRVLRRLAGLLGRTTNVYLGLANFSSHCGLEWLVERGLTDRLVFGTGAPVHDAAGAVTRLMWSELDDEAVAAVGGGNFLRLLSRPVAA